MIQKKYFKGQPVVGVINHFQKNDVVLLPRYPNMVITSIYFILLQISVDYKERFKDNLLQLYILKPVIHNNSDLVDQDHSHLHRLDTYNRFLFFVQQNSDKFNLYSQFQFSTSLNFLEDLKKRSMLWDRLSIII